MLLSLDRAGPTPVFRQILDQVRFQVASGLLAPGTSLPSTRALAVQHGINPMTVSKAYAELEREGVLERRPGQNHVVASRSAPVQELERQGQLARALEGAVLAARQLGFSPSEAAALFQRLVEAAGADERPPP